MIKECKEMYTDVKNKVVDKNFMKDKIIFNASNRIKKGQFAKIFSFNRSTEENNKSHPNMRYFVVQVLGEEGYTNWWLDLSDGSINNDLFIIKSTDVFDKDLIDPKPTTITNKSIDSYILEVGDKVKLNKEKALANEFNADLLKDVDDTKIYKIIQISGEWYDLSGTDYSFYADELIKID